MKLRDAIEKLCEIERGLVVEVEGLGELSVVKAWPSYAPAGTNYETPCFLHTWEMLPLPIASGTPNGLRTLDYTIQIDLYIAESVTDAAAYSEMAYAFNEAFLAALAANLKLEDGSASIDNLRTEGLMPVRLEERWLGLRYMLDFKTTDVALVGP